MNRRFLILFGMIALPLFVAIVALQMRVDAAPTAQLIRDTRSTPGEPEPLDPPLAVVLRQQVPLTLALGLSAVETATTELSATVPVTLSFDFNFVVTQTLTSTVASSITLTFSNGLTLTVPVSLSLGAVPSATLVVTSLEPLTDVAATPTPTMTPTETDTPTPEEPTPTPTATETLTPTVVVTETEPPSAVIPPLTSTVIITSNLRAGPSVEFAVVGQAAPGQSVTVAGVSADGAWYLLTNGAWIAVALVENAPANPPIADEPLIASVQATATALASTVVTETVAATPEAPTVIPLPTPTPVPAPVPPTVTVDANLRSGPGTTFPIIGGTVTGQAINIVARNEAGDWFLLDNGGWVASFLVANPPNIVDVPVFDPNAPPPAAPVTAPAPVTETVPVTAPATVTTTAPIVLGVRDNLYLVDATEVVARYNRALDEIDRLITQAGQNEALLQDPQWMQSMTTVIALLRAADARVRTLQPTTQLQGIHDDLTAAADAFDAAATLLAQGVDQGEPARFDEAFVEITQGTARLVSASDRIEALAP